MRILMLAKPEYSYDLAKLHLKTFSGFFLTSLGEGFLRYLYKGFITHAQSGVIGAFDDCWLMIGFCAYSENISAFYKYLIRSNLIPFTGYSLLAFLKKPSILVRLLKALLLYKKVACPEPFIELSSIGVLPNIGIKGVGTALIKRLIKEANQGRFKYIRLETDKLHNEKANYFYLKNGFVLDHSYVTSAGRSMNAYRYNLDRSQDR